MESTASNEQQPPLSLEEQIEQLNLDPEVKRALLNFKKRLQEEGTNKQHEYHSPPTNPVRLFQAYEFAGNVTSKPLVTAERTRLAEQKLTEILSTANGTNGPQVMKNLLLFLNEYFVYFYTLDYDRYQYSESHKFELTENLANNLLSGSLQVIKSAFEQPNLLDYFEVIEAWNSILTFLSDRRITTNYMNPTTANEADQAVQKKYNSPETLSLFKQVIDTIKENHGKISMDRLRATQQLEQDREREFKWLNDPKVAQKIEAQQKVLVAKIEKVLEEMGIRKGETFNGLDANLDVEKVTDKMERIGKGIIKPNVIANDEARDRRRNPLKNWQEYEETFKKVYE